MPMAAEALTNPAQPHIDPATCTACAPPVYCLQVDAFREYDAVFALSRRKYIPPNFAELRHVVNIAQVRSAPPWPQGER